MHGWGQWYLLPASALAVVSYVLGRRGATWAVTVLLALCEAASTVAVATTHDTLGWLVDQVVIVACGVFGALAGSYRRLRHELTAQGWSRAGAAQTEARLRERARIAAEIHDTLGHELSLLALRAGGIQVTATDPAVREQASELRAGAAEAITKVRRLVDLLGEDPSAGADLGELVARHRAAGTAVSLHGDLPADTSAAARRAVHGVVQQALANVAQHAPGEAVSIELEAPGGGAERDGTVTGGRTTPRGRRAPGDVVTVRVTNACPLRPPSPRPGTGLAAMAERLRLLGGSLRTERRGGRFELEARLPRRAEAAPVVAAGADPEVAVEYRLRRRRARTALLASVLAPPAVLVVLASGFYAWSVHGATIEYRDLARLHVGMSESAADEILPQRQSPVWFGQRTGGDCRYYTDGNYPLAYGNYRICFRDGRISSISGPEEKSP
ncbi:sensor histidine kinase [Streptomyces sp. NPDC021224]|uniref:sensor histidine kinase n=1 Tax=unclassified Streptomyces TaxID=2593676 RepID=UPI003790CA13